MIYNLTWRYGDWAHWDINKYIQGYIIIDYLGSFEKEWKYNSRSLCPYKTFPSLQALKALLPFCFRPASPSASVEKQIPQSGEQCQGARSLHPAPPRRAWGTKPPLTQLALQVNRIQGQSLLPPTSPLRFASWKDLLIFCSCTAMGKYPKIRAKHKHPGKHFFFKLVLSFSLWSIWHVGSGPHPPTGHLPLTSVGAGPSWRRRQR